MLDFRVLGPIELHDGERRIDVPGQRQLALLAYLLMNANEFLLAERLAEDLWPGEDRTVSSLQVTVTRLRKSLAATPATSGLLRTVPGGYRFEIPAGCLDADRFRDAFEEARAMLARGRAEAALETLKAALELWRGQPLAELQEEPFAQPEIARLREEYLNAQEARVECELRLGRHQDIVPELERLTGMYPEREGLVAALMLALYRGGRQADALAAYQLARRRLDELYGLAPGQDLRRIERQVLDQSPDLDLLLPPARTGRARTERRVPAEGPFVGRRQAIAGLQEHLAAVLEGQRRVVVVSGEPGIGKTHLVAQLERMALARGARVLYGGAEDDALAAHSHRGVEDGDDSALPYQPFVEAMGPYVAATRDALDAAGLGAERRELDRILPYGGSVTEPSGEPSLQRFRLFEAVATVLMWTSERAPTVLILDDLQAADRSSHQLLRHLVRAVQDTRLLLVAVHREDDLRPFLSSLRREGPVAHLPLAGLARDDTGALVRSQLPGASEATVDRLVDATSGNPLFVRELTSSIRTGDPAMKIALPDELDPPESVMFLVEQRLGRFDRETVAVLRAAAVAGRDFDLDTVAACVRRAEADVLDALEEPLHAGLIREHWTVADRFSFSHALVRAGLYQSQPKSRRTRLHLAAGEALEARGRHATELAYHFWHARDVGGAERAVRYLTEAGRLADAARAWEDAERHYRRALAALEPHEARDAPRRCELLVAHGHALERSGEAEKAKLTFLRAVEVARTGCDGRLLALAALGYGRAPSGVAEADPVLLRLLEEALAGLDAGDDVLRSRVLGRHAVELAAVTDAEAAGRADALSREAVGLAERAGDDSVLAVALASRHWTLVGPHSLEERCEVARRGLALAERAEDLERILAGRQWWIFDLLELGKIPELVEQLNAYERLASALRHPSDCGYARAMRAMLALLAGDLHAAAEFMREAHELLRRAQDPDADRVRALQSFALDHQAGRLADAARLATTGLQDGPLRSALHAWALAGAGELGEALRVAPAPADVRHDREWLVTMTALARVAALAHDVESAARLRAALNVFEERFAALEGIVAFGPVADPLASLALVLGDTGEARRLRGLATSRSGAVRAYLRSEQAAGSDAERTVPAATAGEGG